MQKYQDVVTVIGPPGLIPVVGTNVSVWRNGTSTNAALYSSNSTNSPLANPLTTDSSGRYSFYAANGRYALNVTGAGIQTTTYNDVLLNDGLGLDVKVDFGAVGDGITDDTTALQNAINAAMLLGAAALVFPSGTYKVSGLTIANYAGQNLALLGYGANILVGANQIGIAISGSQNIKIAGFSFYSTAVSGASQAGISVTLSSRMSIIDNDFRSLTYGIRWISSAVGIATAAAVQIPALISRNIFKACSAGIQLAGTGASTSAEYVCVSSNIINDCTVWGIVCQAGNVRITDNTVTGNAIGIEIDGSQYSNADHGAVTGNTINHNSTCGLYVHDTSADYSYLITGNNIWANIYANFGAGSYAHPFGVILKTCANINFTSNIVARNTVNLGIDVLTTSFIANNTFISDSTRTLFNIYEITAITVANGNKMAPNTFQAALVASANNNDYEQTHTVGASGEPAFTNGWSNLGAGFTAAAFRKDAAGFVHLSGVVTGGTVSASTPVFTLPATYRPAAKFTQAILSNGAIGQIIVDSAGGVQPAAGNNAYFSMDGVSFKAEA